MTNNSEATRRISEQVDLILAYPKGHKLAELKSAKNNIIHLIEQECNKARIDEQKLPLSLNNINKSNDYTLGFNQAVKQIVKASDLRIATLQASLNKEKEQK